MFTMSTKYIYVGESTRLQHCALCGQTAQAKMMNTAADTTCPWLLMFLPLCQVLTFLIWMSSCMSEMVACDASMQSIIRMTLCSMFCCFHTVMMVGNLASREVVGALSLPLISIRTICKQRHTGRGVSWPPNSGRFDPPIRADTTFIRAKDNTFVSLTVSPNGTSIHLPEIRFGWVTKETFIGYYSTIVKNWHCNSSLLFFSPWQGYVTNNLCSPFGQNLVWPPQMDVGPYAYVRKSGILISI